MRKISITLIILIFGLLYGIQDDGVTKLVAPDIKGNDFTIPTSINFQGYLYQDGTPVTTTMNMWFGIYDASINGNLLFEQTINNVTVTNGWFTVNLTDIPNTVFPISGPTRYLEIKAPSTGPALSPRISLVSVGYSYHSLISDSATMAPPVGPGGGDLTGTYPNPTIAGNAVTSVKIQDGQVQTNDIADGNVTMAKINQTSATTGQVIKWTGSAWAPGTDNVGQDNDWVRVGTDSVLYSIRNLGISRGGAGNKLYGSEKYTHVNLGIACTTGMSGFNLNYCTVGGGVCNTASGSASMIGGGLFNRASGAAATVGGGDVNAAIGYCATVPGGSADTASGDYSLAAGQQVKITGQASNTFAFGSNFSTSTPNAVIFHNSVNPIKVGIGTSAPDTTLHIVGNLKMVDGNQAAGKVMVSDANGIGKWQTSPGGPPSGPAGGDLTGTYPSPTILANAVTTLKIADANVTLAKINSVGSTSGQAIVSIGSGAAPTWGNPTPATHTHTASGDVTGTVSGTLTIANNAVNSVKVLDGSLSGTDIAKPCTLSASSARPILTIRNNDVGGGLYIPKTTGLLTPAIRVDTASIGMSITNAALGGISIDGSPTGILVMNTNVGVKVNDANGNGVEIDTASNNGVYIGVANHGVYVDSARSGYCGLYVRKSGNDGIRIKRASDDGIEIDTANWGLYLIRAFNDGVWVDRAGDDGIYVRRASDAGVFVDSAYYGVQIGKCHIGVDVDSSYAGFDIDRAGLAGLYVTRSGMHGVYIDSAVNGLYVKNPQYGVYIDNASMNGVRSNSNNGRGGYFRNDNNDYYTLEVVNNTGSGAGIKGLRVQGAGYATGGWQSYLTKDKIGFSLASPNLEVVVSGSASLRNGVASIELEKDMQEVFSGDVPLKVIATPTSECNGMCVLSKTTTGFTVKELMSGKSNASFDWMVIGRIKGYEKNLTIHYFSDEGMGHGKENQRTELLRKQDTEKSMIELKKQNEQLQMRR